MEVVRKTMNAKERNSHNIPFPCWVVQASPNAWHTLQTIIPGKVNPDTEEKKKAIFAGLEQQK